MPPWPTSAGRPGLPSGLEQQRTALVGPGSPGRAVSAGSDFKLYRGNLYVDVGDGNRWFLAGPGIRYTFKVGTCYQAAAVVRSTHVTLYVNGRSIGSESYPFGTGEPLLFDRAHRVYLGTNARYTDEGFRGRIGEVAIFLRPLTSDQINGLYHSGIAG